MGRRVWYALLIALGVVWPNGGWSESRGDARQRHAAARRAVLTPVAPPAVRTAPRIQQTTVASSARKHG